MTDDLFATIRVRLQNVLSTLMPVASSQKHLSISLMEAMKNTITKVARLFLSKKIKKKMNPSVQALLRKMSFGLCAIIFAVVKRVPHVIQALLQVAVKSATPVK